MPAQVDTSSRRQFLWWMGVGFTGTAMGCRQEAARQTTGPPSWQPPHAGRSAPVIVKDKFNPREFVRRTSRALGTKVTLTIAPPADSDPDQILSAAFGVLDRVEDVMSLYRPHSQLCELNRNGELTSADPMLIRVLTTARRISEMTGGAFDVTIQPLWDLHWSNPAPSAQQLAEAQSQIDYRRISINDRQVRLASGTRLTLNGIAQGYALDAVRQTLADHGVTAAMIDTGEVGALGDKRGAPWRTGIQHPTTDDALAGIVAMDGRCLATSGDYATRFSDDQHHLLDPRTGSSPAILSSVSVLAPTGLLADALSTAAFIMGPVDGMRLIHATKDVDGMMITKTGKTLTTRGFPIV